MEEKEMNNTNYGKAIPLDNIPISKCEEALKAFSNGSIALEKCLRVLWMHGLKTYSSYLGKKDSFDIGYIVMEENEDIFSYLSEDFLNNDEIRIDIIDNKQEIEFAGSYGEKENSMLFLAREILSGRKKNNTNLVLEKIGKPFPDSWVRRLRSYNSNINSTYWSEKVLIKRKS